MKGKGVKPVAYVYPILAFLSGTVGCPPGAGRCEQGTNPSWIVNGSYDLEDRSAAGRAPLSLRGHEGNGPMRASLAAASLQRWLPDMMVAFAAQTGAGGFGFDYTYFEQNSDGTAGTTVCPLVASSRHIAESDPVASSTASAASVTGPAALPAAPFTGAAAARRSPPPLGAALTVKRGAPEPARAAGSAAKSVTRCPAISRTPAAAAASSSAPMIDDDRSETGKTLPSASAVVWTPRAANHSRVSRVPHRSNDESSSAPPRG